jgi:tetratricopeptide (TPR) repeat protein
MQKARWINIPWLFEVVHALLMRLGPALNPTDPDQAFQIGATALIVATALARVLTGWALLAIRRPGPGLWWSAVCITVALGIVIGPRSFLVGPNLIELIGSPQLGGIAGVAEVLPEVWGVCLLAVEILLLFRLFGQGSKGSGILLVPLFLLWANVDESFLYGLLVLGASVIGHLARPTRLEGQGDRRISRLNAVALLGVSAAVCLINPSFAQAFNAAGRSLVYLFQYPSSDKPTDYIGLFGSYSARFFNQDAGEIDLQRRVQVYFFVYVAIGLLSFVLNYRRFSLSRLLVYIVAAVLWGASIRLSSSFAVVFAATLALNGQEWYHDRFGVEGRLGWRWATWSVGGRLVTLTVLTLAMIKATTGLGALPGETYFSFGVDRDDYHFEAVDALRSANLRGRVLNTSLSLGDDLIWKAPGEIRTFIDSRRHVFPPGLLDLRLQVLRAIRDGNKEGENGWKKTLDDYGISAVMVRVGQEQRVEEALRRSPDWIEFHYDGSAAIFGRLDAPNAEDVAYFESHRLDAEDMVYKRDQTVSSPDRPPSPVSWIDRVQRTRVLVSKQPRVTAAMRWMAPPAGVTQPLPEPAQCVMAIREARAALSVKPDDTDAFRVLAFAYNALWQRESEWLASEGIEPNPQLMMLRYRQLVTSLNFAIQTTPPPQTASARDDLRFLRMQLANLYRGIGAVDLEQQQLAEAEKLAAPDGLEPAERERLEQLAKYLDELRQNLETQTRENNLGPLQRAQFARQSGAFDLAIEELRKAEGLAPISADLLDLLCQVGRADEAIDLLGTSLDNPEISTGPGTSAYRQGLVTILALGNYDATASSWFERALPQLRASMTTEGLMAGRGLLSGDAIPATTSFLELPQRVLVEADWCYQLGLCLLEGGHPVERTIELGGRPQVIPGAAEQFELALKLEPELPVRPIIAYYLEKLGRTVPPLPEPTKPVTEPATEGSPEPRPSSESPDASKPAQEHDEKAKAAEEPETPKEKEPPTSPSTPPGSD